jgi:hypothetical protein
MKIIPTLVLFSFFGVMGCSSEPIVDQPAVPESPVPEAGTLPDFTVPIEEAEANVLTTRMNPSDVTCFLETANSYR